MRIIQRQVKDQPLTVIIEYPKMEPGVERLVKKIESMNVRFKGKTEEKSVSIDAADVYYLESVERKIFLYAKDQVYRYDGSLADLEEDLAATEFVRISRTCIMNAEHLREIRQIKNSHLEAILDNGEKLIVFRKYLQDVKKLFGRMR
ncbi:MAG: LytTR family transcriptional regulator DNA-binding domain-containing protein [Lachnospiraceae bacterium]|nr:LytTR family transcriptional regulator DNA-binding domain-containing protein [Lachnospiraceae bacterium]